MRGGKMSSQIGIPDAAKIREGLKNDKRDDKEGSLPLEGAYRVCNKESNGERQQPHEQIFNEKADGIKSLMDFAW